MIEYILFVVGFALLLKSAEYLVEGASSLAKQLGLSPLVIGLTIVAFGTSFPELIVSILAALRGSGDIVFGNVIGSSLANTLLILGIMALIANLKVKSSTTWKEIPFAFLAVGALFILSLGPLINGSGGEVLSRTDGIMFLLFFSIFLYYVFEIAKKDKELIKQTESQEIKEHPRLPIFLMIVGGLIGLFIGGKLVVDGAIVIAQTLGLSEFVVSAIIVAIGTSLPELVTSIVAALKKKIDLAVGSIVGSNIFNIFWVLGLAAIIRPIEFPALIEFDLLILLFATFLLFLFMFTGKKYELDRWEGIVLLLLYIGYIIIILFRG